MDSSVPAGPLSIRIRTHISADGVALKGLRAIAEEGKNRCPVCDALGREVPTTVEIETS